MEVGDYEKDSDFEDSDDDYETEEESSPFVVDGDLEDGDDDDGGEEQSRKLDLPYESFLYEICNVPTSIVLDVDVIKEDGETDLHEEDEVEEYGVHNPNTNWKTMRPHLGERYANIDELRNCLTNYGVANGYPLVISKSSPDRLQVRCGTSRLGERCPFQLWASWMKKERSFQIESLEDKHGCLREFRVGALVNPHWIAKHFIKDLCVKPRMKANDMRLAVKKKFLCEVSIGQCYRAKKHASEVINGKITEHYARIWDYAQEILRSNPGSTTKVGVTVNPGGITYFHRLYVCFTAVREGWYRGCKRVIGLDGCFLKGQCKGELLTAIGRDANNQVYPIAWEVVDLENKANWKWLIELLADDVDLHNGLGLMILSDQHKVLFVTSYVKTLKYLVFNLYISKMQGLMEAVKEILPSAEHRQCARHVYANSKRS